MATLGDWSGSLQDGAIVSAKGTPLLVSVFPATQVLPSSLFLCSHQGRGGVNASPPLIEVKLLSYNCKNSNFVLKLVQTRRILIHLHVIVAGTVCKSNAQHTALKIEIILSLLHNARIKHEEDCRYATLHIPASCPRFGSLLHVSASYPRFISPLHVPSSCPCFMFPQHVPASYPHFISPLHIPARYPRLTFPQHVPASCRRFIFLLHFLTSCIFKFHFYSLLKYFF